MRWFLRITYGDIMTDNNKTPYFTKEKRDTVIKTLNDKWENKRCECCGHSIWNVSEDIVCTPILEGGITLGGKTYPHVLVICGNCGSTKLFNAVILGAVESTAKEEIKESDKVREQGKKDEK
jgi:predicted nucleic-acid-binding Zn-ribbon protein